MDWLINPVVTVNGTDYTATTLNGLSINYGRTDIWEQPRAGYASIQILNDNDSIFSAQLNDPVVIQVDDSSGNPITVFTGVVNGIQNDVRTVGSTAKVVFHTIQAIAPLADMSRIITHTSSWPKEYDDNRMTRILTDAGVVIDVVDSPGVYELTATTASPNDAYYWASFYANMAFGYIYETTDGKVGYANESRRTVEAAANGYFVIPENVILAPSIQSSINLNNLLNDLRLEYKNNQIVTATNASSIASYGKRAADIQTELEQGVQAQFQADRYMALRSTPSTILRSFTVQLNASTITSTVLDGLISVYMGKPIQVTDFPNGIHNGIFKGFVEGWNLILNRNTATITLNVTDKNLSITPTRWQDVPGTLQWEDVTPTVEWADYE